MSNPYDCSHCHNEGFDHDPDCPFHPDNLAARVDEDIASLDLRAAFEAEGRTRWSEADESGTVTVHPDERRQ